MGRQKNDGRGRLGGRKLGTPNDKISQKTLRNNLRSHSAAYFQPDEETGLSQYDRDVAKLSAKDRVSSELALLKFSAPQMQATSVDMMMSEEGKQTFGQRLTALAEQMDGKE